MNTALLIIGAKTYQVEVTEMKLRELATQLEFVHREWDKTLAELDSVRNTLGRWAAAQEERNTIVIKDGDSLALSE